MLLGVDIHVFTGHKNLTFDTLKMKVHITLVYKNWRVFTHVALHQGRCKTLTNNLSCLHHLVTPAQIAEGKKLVEPVEVSNKKEDKACCFDQEYSGLYDNKVCECNECYLNLPETPYLDQNPLSYTCICQLQQQAEQLLALQVKNPDNYVNLQLNDNVNDIICCKKDRTQPNCPNQW